MINKIGPNYTLKFKNYQLNSNEKPQNSTSQNNYSNITDLNNIPFYKHISFGANRKNTNKLSQREELEYYYTNTATDFINEATKLAKDNKNSEITHFHIWRVALNQIEKYIDDLNSGTKVYEYKTNDSLPSFFEMLISNNIFRNKEIRTNFKKVITEEKNILDNIIAYLPKDEKVTSPKLSEKVVKDIWNPRINGNERVYDFNIIASALYSEDEQVQKFLENFVSKTYDLTMVNHEKLEERAHIKAYDEKAKNVWKNLSLDTNMFVTYDHKKVNPHIFINSLYYTKPDDTDITLFEINAKEQCILDKVKELSKDKSKKHALILFPTNMLVNSATEEELKNQVFAYSTEFQSTIAHLPPNIKFIMVDPKDNYFLNMQQPLIQNMYENFGEMSIPVLSSQQFSKAFIEDRRLMKDIKKPFSKKAIEKTVDIAAQLDGIYPDKAIKLMKKISSFYVDKREITEKEVLEYAKEAKELFKKNDDDNSLNILFDTNKRIKDIVGKDATKKEVASIVKQIKSNHMGTKGTVIYSQDHTAGSGRRFIAKVIAGEAKIPYMEINAMDFGTKEVDIFGGNVLTPEASIKKMFSLVNTQAENNANKSAVLFIENFEYFSIGELISEYQQKAMAQLLREMDNAERKGLNILVLGSVSDPTLIGEATMKSFKFVDTIEVSSPAFNDKERADIIKDTLKEYKIKLAGKTPEEKNEIIKTAAQTTQGFPFIYVKNLVKKAQSVAIERGHREITKADFTEAYLQITTGRPETAKVEPHEKDIVTSHECGHAVNAEIMNDIAKKYGKPWHKSKKVNFVTLDPRGNASGSMYPIDDSNKEQTFEKNFAFIVCAYGGHSCEKYFYDMDGSYGIYGDLEAATGTANIMIRGMGQGAKIGKQSLYMAKNISEKMLEKMEDDRNVILRNALLVSDLITETYADFNREFTKKYSHLVGSGDCLVDGKTFRQELEEWKARQSDEKQAEIQLMENMILDIIKNTKKGVLY